MSLINKMLQDLDARGGNAGQQMQEAELKAVPAVERDRKPLLLAGGGVLVLLLAAGGWLGWKSWQGRALAPQPAAVPTPTPAAPVPPMLVLAPTAPAAPAAPALAAEAAAPVASTAANGAAQVAGPVRALAAASAAGPAAAPAAAPRTSAPAVEADMREMVAARRKQRLADKRAEAGSPGLRIPPVVTGSGHTVRDLGPEQVAENAYRRALVSLQEGRVAEAMGDLERALEVNPRNEAARQTYISLLLESKRTEEAVRQLRLGLGIDPRQPGLAMVLARLQLEKGGPALETLLKTLPYAGSSAEYRALLAGVQQKQQHHAEAIEQYEEALKLAPQNSVWWMGLGISLQAEQRLPEAREAYLRAKSGNGLSAELQAFVTRKLDQLAR